MINLTWLKTFCTLAEVGHFTQTADKLFMTQSGVSQHIKKLEQRLKIDLLVREGKSFSLTDAGEKLYSKGQEILKSSEELVYSIKHDDQHEGMIKIASPGSIGLRLYSYLLEVQQSHPKLLIDYIFAPNKNIEKDLVDHNIDLGLITELSHINSLKCQKIAMEPLVLVTPNNVKSISWQKLLELGFISHPDAAHHGQMLLSKNFSKFEHIEQFPRNGFSNQISLILKPVSKGFGFTVLPLHAAKEFHQQELIKIHGLERPVSESIYICFNRHSILANRIKFIKTAVTDFLSEAK